MNLQHSVRPSEIPAESDMTLMHLQDQTEGWDLHSHKCSQVPSLETRIWWELSEKNMEKTLKNRDNQTISDLPLLNAQPLPSQRRNGACILDVDPATARYILAYNFEPALSAAFPEKKTELRIVTVWVSMQSLDPLIN